MASGYSDRNILNGQHLLIGSNFPYDCISYSTNTDKPTTYEQLNSGLEYFLIEFLSLHYNHTYGVINGGYKYGTVLNGSIDGVCGMVNRSEVDMASWVTISDFRKPFVDFSLPYSQQPVTFMMATKVAKHDKSFDISNTDYRLMGILILWAFFVSVIIGFISNRMLVNTHSKYKPFWSLYQCFVQKGNDEDPANSNLRIIFILWLFIGLIAVTTVAGELVSMLAGQPPTYIKTIDELADETNIRIYITSKPVQVRIQMSPNKKVKKMMRRQLTKEPDLNFDKTKAFIRNDMMKKPIAYIMNKLELDCHRKKINEKLIYIPSSSPENSFSTMDVGIAMPKKSKLTPYFNFAIRRLQEIGVLNYWDWLSQLHLTNFTSSFEVVESDAIFKQVGINSFGHLFYLLPFAVIITTNVLLFEMLCHKVKSKK